jgi:hypothetical protein
MEKNPTIIYVDVDDTLMRTFGSKRIPMTPVVNHVRQLKAEGATLYCWSSGGAEYAQSSAQDLASLIVSTPFCQNPTSSLTTNRRQNGDDYLSSTLRKRLIRT